ncbi:MAG: malto-oligosyltrehalose trehalohydrolase [Nitrospirota bacterium]|nr:malto-oligosyltrehalose trehalohydrolase [Nitrospirota bacterium]
MRIGSFYLGNGECEFVVWSPLVEKLAVKIVSPVERLLPMEKDGAGYWKVAAGEVLPGTRYFYRIEDGRERPDPASNFQPLGVHGPSQVVDHGSFLWEDMEWRGTEPGTMIIYELHVGAFTQDGSFDALARRIGELKEFGINSIEIMPVAQFPGERNWGYDGVCPFAVQGSYGGPEGLKRVVNECHKEGMAVILDVVYNHLGPEGNYIWDFGPYFTDKYKTPWGWAINFDDAYSDDVRNYFIENALYWFDNFHIDALRLDAVHAIYDFSAKPFLTDLSENVDSFSSSKGRKFYLIAESDLNDARVILGRESGGYGIDAQWCDDFHHSVHTILTNERTGYYMDFGRIEDLVKSLKEGFVYSWDYSAYRKRRHGSSSRDFPADQFIVSSQNHDQVGNRMLGERLSSLVTFEALKMAAGVVLFSPYIPLLFMGEEYGEDSPFLYFVSHSDADLIESVRKGRINEFNSFAREKEFPDPQDVETFRKSKIDWEKREEGHHKVMLDFYRRLIKLRKEIPALSCPDRTKMEVTGMEEEKIVFIRRWKDDSHVFMVFNFNGEESSFNASFPEGVWRKLLDSSDGIWNGPGMISPDGASGEEFITMKGLSFAVYTGEGVL